MELVDLLNSRNARPEEEGGKLPGALLAPKATTLTQWSLDARSGRSTANTKTPGSLHQSEGWR